MNQCHKEPHRFAWGGLLAAAAAFFLCACEGAREAAPRPMTVSGHVITTQLDVTVSPAPPVPPPGQM